MSSSLMKKFLGLVLFVDDIISGVGFCLRLLDPILVFPKLFLMTYHLWDPLYHYVPPFPRKTQYTKYHSITSLENQN